MTDTARSPAAGGYIRPAFRRLPTPGTESGPFWTGGTAGRLLIQHCRSCDRFFHPPAPVCWRCRSTDVAPAPVSGRGTVATFTVNHQQWLPSMPPPYVIALVTLDDEPDIRLMTQLVDVEPEQVSFGMAVEVFFEQWPGDDGRPDVALPLFRPVTEPFVTGSSVTGSSAGEPS